MVLALVARYPISVGGSLGIQNEFKVVRAVRQHGNETKKLIFVKRKGGASTLDMYVALRTAKH
ncbi:MAG: hypothetical protein CMN58_01810 [Solibacterales bacterium]|nr:hypothetical protein [Bryobacterales bacterium]